MEEPLPWYFDIDWGADDDAYPAPDPVAPPRPPAPLGATVTTRKLAAGATPPPGP